MAVRKRAKNAFKRRGHDGFLQRLRPGLITGASDDDLWHIQSGRRAARIRHRVLAQIFFKYERYVAILKWLTLALFAYVIALFMVKVPWNEALAGLLIPKI
jgi:hypothetical protein